VIYGSGVQIKVLEAFESSTPLVATSTALRGLNVKHAEQALIADNPADFANAVVRLLRDAALQRQIGTAGRRYVETHHDLSKTTDNLVNFYKQTIDAWQSGHEEVT
ncbi:MAG TPA: glycosyltransferase, partial [Aggregatilineales bacterium]|nr:glycosyltransferase [Aggregatilineales bacterium]